LISSRNISKKEENISFFDGDTVVWSDDMNDNKKVERFVGMTREIRFFIPMDFYWGEGEEPNEFFLTTTRLLRQLRRKRRIEREE